SSDGGQTWNTIGGGLPRYIITTLAIHPASADVMWAGTSGAGIYKTTDGGRTWTETNRGFAASWIQKVWGDAAGTIIAQTTRGLFRTDGKSGWTEVLQPFSDDEARADIIIFDAKAPRMVHAGWASSYYRSTDAGITWTEIDKPFQDPSPSFSSLAIDPKNPKVLYSADRNASSGDPLIFKSTDGGVRWKPANRGVTGTGILALIADSAGTLFALGTEGGFWRSADGATTWTAAGSGLPSKNLKGLALDSTNAARMYVAGEDAFYRSEDGGSTFTSQKLEPEAVIVDAKGSVYVGTFEGVSRSSDGGRTWTPFNDGLTNVDVRALHIAGSRLYAGTAGGGVFWIDLD
ncbi:MAG TPA: hypothetical protein VEK56_01435, partial [Vicinamibacterales bacterium]|nr:hypothetical protein [Vicinamibacterales bacterium]